MGKLQKALQTELQKVPAIALRSLIKRKLKKAGRPIGNALADKIIAHVLGGGVGELQLNGDGPDIHLKFDEEDVAELNAGVEKIIDSLPKILEELSQSMAKEMLKIFKLEWKNHRENNYFVDAHFRQNLEARWHRGLNGLRLLLDLACSAGEDFHRRLARSRSKKTKHLPNALARLHVRACQVAAEIIVLLENGFADGAMARWRTLYEITVIAIILSDGPDDLAERYLAHDAVETKRAIDEYAHCHAALGYRPPSKANVRHVNNHFNAALKKFGNDFRRQYGWAVGHLKKANPNPTFRDLEEAAGRAAMRPYYKLASYNIHASPKALFNRIGAIGPASLVAGATNAGLEEPGQNTAFTLTQVTSMIVVGRRANFDGLVQVQVMVALRDEAVGAFISAARRLRRDDARVRRQQRA